VVHQRIELEILIALTQWCRAAPRRGAATAPLGLGLVLDEHNYYEPDALRFRAGREPGPDATLQPMPDIAGARRAVRAVEPGCWLSHASRDREANTRRARL
jgi:hypothetical protein